METELFKENHQQDTLWMDISLQARTIQMIHIKAGKKRDENFNSSFIKSTCK